MGGPTPERCAGAPIQAYRAKPRAIHLMADVLLLSRYERLGASSRVRSYQFLPALAAAGIEVEVCPMFDDAYLRARHAGSWPIGRVLSGYARRIRDAIVHRKETVVWLEYELLPWVPYALEQVLFDSDRALVIDYDDAIFHRYDCHRNGIVRALLRDKIDRLMRAASVVITGNQYLAARARAAGARRVELLPSVIDLSRYRQKDHRSANAGFTIGWIGSPYSTRYLPSLEPVLRQLGDVPGLSLINVGGKAWQPPGIAVDNRPWTEDTEVQDMLHFDVGVMPLPDEPWERGKCAFKLIQYMGCALPVVASPVSANAEIVEHGRTGFLATTTREWSDALRTLAADPELRARMGTAGLERCRSHYSLSVVAPRLTALFGEVIELARRENAGRARSDRSTPR